MRIANENDIDSLYEIYSHESVSPNMGFDPCSRSEFDEIYRELSSGGDLLVSENENRIVAVCKVVYRKRRLRHSAYIGSLAVHPLNQGSGVGKEYFLRILNQLKGERLSRIELLVAADNFRAIEFFKSFEFLIEGTHKNYFSRAGDNTLFSEHTMAWIQNS